MKTINDIHKIYFIGIGGIGMSALARYFNWKGKTVSGYDRTETALTKQLTEEGISITYTDDAALVPKDVDAVVYTPAIPKDHTGLVYYREHGYELLKRSDVLGIITESSFNICVAGTHGKTTTTTMIAHILRHSGYGCNAFLGGIAANYNSNFWSDERNVCVVEADEYDRSFLKLSPDIAIITAMDPDHLDIYGTAAEMDKAFVAFSGRIKKGGVLISKLGLEKKGALHADHHFSYALSNTAADITAINIVEANGGYVFDVKSGNDGIEKISLNMGGLHNVENATVAISVAMRLGIAEQKIKAAIAAFRGVKRRFEYIIAPSAENDFVYVDDYAHHPAELEALIKSAASLFREKKCTVVFQPHLYSRTKDFADGFAQSLNLADEVILLPVYPARELPVEGVSSVMIADRMDTGRVRIMEKDALLHWIKQEYKNRKNELLITAGAGDIDKLVPEIKNILTGA